MDVQELCLEKLEAAEEMIGEHEAEIARMVTKKEHDETVFVLQACSASSRMYLCVASSSGGAWSEGWPCAFVSVCMRACTHACVRGRAGAYPCGKHMYGPTGGT